MATTSGGRLVAHDCGYPLSRYTCRATRVATDLLDFIAFCRCSTGVALHPLKILVSHLAPPAVPGGVAPKFGSEKVSRYTGVSQLQLRVSRYTVQLRVGGFASSLLHESCHWYYPRLLCPFTVIVTFWAHNIIKRFLGKVSQRPRVVALIATCSAFTLKGK